MSDLVGNPEHRFSHVAAHEVQDRFWIEAQSLDVITMNTSHESRREKTGLRDFRPGPT